MDLSDIHTTVNLGLHQAVLLNESAVRLGVTRSRLVVLLMRKVLLHWKRMKRNFSTVKYQKSGTAQEWKTVHVFLRKEDYEIFIDMRKFFKWSVSALVAMAIKEYLHEILEGDRQHFQVECDNYKINNYECTGKLDNNKICWHIIWELDEKFAKKLYF